MVPGRVIHKGEIETAVEEEMRRKKIKSLQKKNKRNKGKRNKKC